MVPECSDRLLRRDRAGVVLQFLAGRAIAGGQVGMIVQQNETAGIVRERRANRTRVCIPMSADAFGSASASRWKGSTPTSVD